MSFYQQSPIHAPVSKTIHCKPARRSPHARQRHEVHISNLASAISFILVAQRPRLEREETNRRSWACFTHACMHQPPNTKRSLSFSERAQPEMDRVPLYEIQNAVCDANAYSFWNRLHKGTMHDSSQSDSLNGRLGHCAVQ